MPRASVRSRRAPRGALVALVLAVALAACAPPFPSEEDFYQPPSPLPAGQPGDVIRSRDSRFTIDLAGKVPVAGVTAKQVLYRSTDALGLVPDDPRLGRFRGMLANQLALIDQAQAQRMAEKMTPRLGLPEKSQRSRFFGYRNQIALRRQTRL